MHQGRTGGHDNAVELVLGYVLLDQLLAGLGAHKLVVLGDRNVRQTLSEADDLGHIHRGRDVRAAVADVDAYPDLAVR